MKKFLFFLIYVLFLSSCGTSDFDKKMNTAFNEAYYVSELSKEITERTALTWSKAINDHRDSHGEYCYDFNRAIQTLYMDYNDAAVFDSLKMHYNNMEALAKEMSDCPSSRKDAYNELVNLVADTKTLYNMALDPSGNLQSFTQDTRQAYTTIEKSLNQFEIKNSNILTNVIKAKNPLAEITLYYELHKAEIEAIKAELKEKELGAVKEAAKKFFEDNKKNDGVVELPSGLQIKTIVEGKGRTPSEYDKVIVDYKGTFVDGKEFDANDDIEFNVNSVVAGFREGLMNMKEGGKSILYIPSDLGYGERGAGTMIPGNTILIFEVTLKKVKRN